MSPSKGAGEAAPSAQPEVRRFPAKIAPPENCVQTLVNVTLPEMGESVSEGSIVEWRKKVGEWVDEGETLVDITTDKVDVEVPATAGGLITALHGDEGATVPVGSVLAEIDTTAQKPANGPSAGEPPANGAAASEAPAAAGASPTAPNAPTASAASAQPNVTLSLSKGAPPSAAPSEPTLVTPPSYGAPGSATPPPERHAPGNGKTGGTLSHHARRLVDRLHIDASKLTGTGPDGLILREDVEAAVASGKIAFSGGLGSASPAAALTYPPLSRPRRKSPSSKARSRRSRRTWTSRSPSRSRRRSARCTSGRSSSAAPS